jgi:hypothetical protein
METGPTLNEFPIEFFYNINAASLTSVVWILGPDFHKDENKAKRTIAKNIVKTI